jgi:hypothetical protein
VSLAPKSAQERKCSVFYSFGVLLLSLQFTLLLSPFFGQGCFCDCCSLAPREVSLLLFFEGGCGVESDGVVAEGDCLESEGVVPEGDWLGDVCAPPVSDATNKAITKAARMGILLTFMVDSIDVSDLHDRPSAAGRAGGPCLQPDCRGVADAGGGVPSSFPSKLQKRLTSSDCDSGSGNVARLVHRQHHINRRKLPRLPGPFHRHLAGSRNS